MRDLDEPRTLETENHLRLGRATVVSSSLYCVGFASLSSVRVSDHGCDSALSGGQEPESSSSCVWGRHTMGNKEITNRVYSQGKYIYRPLEMVSVIEACRAEDAANDWMCDLYCIPAYGLVQASMCQGQCSARSYCSDRL